MNPTVSTPITLSPAPMPNSAPSIANSSIATRSAATSHDGLRRGIWPTVVRGMRVVGSSKLAVMVEFLDRRPSGRHRACRRGTNEAVHQGARSGGDATPTDRGTDAKSTDQDPAADHADFVGDRPYAGGRGEGRAHVAAGDVRG